jgi:uncharacterized protein (TIGR02145 family)
MPFMKTKSRIWFFQLIVMGLVLIIANSCKKSDQGQLPVVFTTEVLNFWPTFALCSGNITSNGGSRLSEQGFCWSTGHMPDTTDNKIMMAYQIVSRYSKMITGLSPQTDYYVRAYATNSIGTAYGEEMSFTTPADHTGEAGKVADVEGNVYQTIGIGSQVWMAENLKTTKFNDGIAIPLVTDGAAWEAFSYYGYCWYNNDEATYKSTYGALYNWYVVNIGKLCPVGWHVASDGDWRQMILFLDPNAVLNDHDCLESQIAGGKLKEAGTIHWQSPNTGATNETGFTALPGGGRQGDGMFYGIGSRGFWWISWSSTELGPYQYMYYDDSSVERCYIYKNYGFAVRCLKDN